MSIVSLGRTPFTLMLSALVLAGVLCPPLLQAASADSPNVILVITDDQGYGDVAAHGNTMIKTPNLDELYAESVRLTDFHVDPTCSPSRSALMSGRYSTRTGVWHTIMGRSLMNTKEYTVAEMFRDDGYKTGMFGKWHLGDNYPCRPQDQGFGDVFCHGGGGVGQGPDYWGNDYFDDTYFRNGTPEKVSGYCTDVWFENALAFIEQNKEQPFFCYLATNAPHGPYLVAEEYSEPYVEQGVPDVMAKFYGMITNIDENMGRLVKRLEELELDENTILVFMTDNGTAAGMSRRPEDGKWKGYNAGMRGTKGSPYDGGHRVPFYVRWPKGELAHGSDVDQLTAHVDVLPTLAELCGIPIPDKNPLDGASLAAALRGDTETLRDRTLFVHSQRIPYPEKWRQSSVMTEQWRLVNGEELYDIKLDPGEEKDLAGDKPELLRKMREDYNGWWESLEPVFDETVYPKIGSEEEPVSLLHAHDWHVSAEQNTTPWSQGHVKRGDMMTGAWVVDVARPGFYEITLRRWPEQLDQSLEATKARLKIGDFDHEQTVLRDPNKAVFHVPLRPGPARIETWLTMPNGKVRSAYFAYVKRLEP